MPLINGKDSTGSYYKWGNTGKKYYYKTGSKRSRELAKKKAMKQARAIEWRKSSAKKSG